MISSLHLHHQSSWLSSRLDQLHNLPVRHQRDQDSVDSDQDISNLETTAIRWRAETMNLWWDVSTVLDSVRMLSASVIDDKYAFNFHLKTVKSGQFNVCPSESESGWKVNIKKLY